MQENYKILVVDDDMRLRALLERYLTEQGFQVRSVANAEQMDRLLTRESFHLMVLDLMLPGEDGLSICRRLRSQSNPMPIIMSMLPSCARISSTSLSDSVSRAFSQRSREQWQWKLTDCGSYTVTSS